MSCTFRFNSFAGISAVQRAGLLDEKIPSFIKLEFYRREDLKVLFIPSQEKPLKQVRQKKK
jgi:hypothetical protein